MAARANRRPRGSLEAGPGLGWGNPAKCLDFSPTPLPRQSAPLLRRGRTCAPVARSRGQQEPCQAQTSVPSSPATQASSAFSPLPPGIALPAPAQQPQPRRDPQAPLPDRAAAEVSRLRCGGDRWRRTKGRRAPGSGGRKPQPGESRARGVAWVPERAQEGAGGAASGSAGRAGRGVARPAGRGCWRPAVVADLCARSRRGSLVGSVCWLRASTSSAGNSSVRPCVGAPSSRRRLSAVPAPRQGPGFKLSVQGEGAEACCPGWLEDLLELREEAPQVFLGPLRPRRGAKAGRVSVLACAPWLSGRRRTDGGGGGERTSRVQGDCLPFEEGTQLVATTLVGKFLGIKQKNPLPSQRIRIWGEKFWYLCILSLFPARKS